MIKTADNRLIDLLIVKICKKTARQALCFKSLPRFVNGLNYLLKTALPRAKTPEQIAVTPPVIAP